MIKIFYIILADVSWIIRRTRPWPKYRYLLGIARIRIQDTLPISTNFMPALLHIPIILSWKLRQHCGLHCREMVILEIGKLHFIAWHQYVCFYKRTLSILYNVHVPPRYRNYPTIQEKKLSTAYILLEIFLQILVSNIVLTAIGYGLYTLGVGSAKTYIGFGTLPLVFVFIWHKVAQNPEEPTRFCWFPCQIPMKYVPFCFLLFFVLFGNIIAPCVYCALGYIQFMVLARSFIRLPLKIYNKFDSLMPNGIR